MTKNVIVLLANGFEEIEALAPVDILRRAGFEVELIGILDLQVTGSHGITVVTEGLLSEKVDRVYDLVILPGGLPGAEHLRDDHHVIDFVRKQAENQSLIAAICAAPIVLERAGLLRGKCFTAYPSFEKQITSTPHYTQTIVERDGQMITSRGAGAALEFGYYLVEQLGGSADDLREGMCYSELLAWHCQKDQGPSN